MIWNKFKFNKYLKKAAAIITALIFLGSITGIGLYWHYNNTAYGFATNEVGFYAETGDLPAFEEATKIYNQKYPNAEYKINYKPVQSQFTLLQNWTTSLSVDDSNLPDVYFLPLDRISVLAEKGYLLKLAQENISETAKKEIANKIIENDPDSEQYLLTYEDPTVPSRNGYYAIKYATEAIIAYKSKSDDVKKIKTLKELENWYATPSTQKTDLNTIQGYKKDKFYFQRFNDLWYGMGLIGGFGLEQFFKDHKIDATKKAELLKDYPKLLSYMQQNHFSIDFLRKAFLHYDPQKDDWETDFTNAGLSKPGNEWLDKLLNFIYDNFKYLGNIDWSPSGSAALNSYIQNAVVKTSQNAVGQTETTLANKDVYILDGIWQLGAFQKLFGDNVWNNQIEISAIPDIDTNVPFLQAPGGSAYGFSSRLNHEPKKLEAAENFLKILYNNHDVVQKQFQSGSRIVVGQEAKDALLKSPDSLIPKTSKQAIQAVYNSKQFDQRIDAFPEFFQMWQTWGSNSWSLIYDASNISNPRLKSFEEMKALLLQNFKSTVQQINSNR